MTDVPTREQLQRLLAACEKALAVNQRNEPAWVTAYAVRRALDIEDAASEAVTEDVYAALVRAVGSQTAADAALTVLAPALIAAGRKQGEEAGWDAATEKAAVVAFCGGARQAVVDAIRALGRPA